MARNARRLIGAVFLCLIVALALGVMMERSFVLQAKAQTMMTVRVMACNGGPLSDPDPAMIEAGGQVHDLDESETAAYVAATSQGSRYVRDVLLRAVQLPDGSVIAVLHDEGEICYILNVSPQLHRETMTAINGEPV
ncbi:MAG: hypothetical protein ACE37E_01305 [Hyphomicrobiales bacterium]